MERDDSARPAPAAPVAGAHAGTRAPGIWPWADEWVGLGYAPEELGLVRLRHRIGADTSVPVSEIRQLTDVAAEVRR
jgi:hypothetical protein